jgi:hypothetical protein
MDWSVPRIWEGAPAFIVAGGPSVLDQPIHRLRGHRVIAINSSIETLPWADFLFTMDGRWLDHSRRNGAINRFAGRVVTDSQFPVLANWDRPLRLRRAPPPGLSEDPEVVVGHWTSLHGGLNLATLLGAGPIVILGADGGPNARGRTHHHRPHIWRTRAQAWEDQRADLRTTLEPLRAMNIEVFNCSPGTHWSDLWPVVDRLEDFL